MNKQSLPRGKSLLQSIERIGNLAVECKGDPEKLTMANPDNLALSAFLEIEPLQAAIFSVIFLLNFKSNSVDITEMARILPGKCRCTKFCMANTHALTACWLFAMRNRW